jgi:hypothetical protein
MGMAVKIARALQLAAAIREQSWDGKSEYKTNLYVAASQALVTLELDKELYEPLAYLLKGYWNDSLNWAERTCGERESFLEENKHHAWVKRIFKEIKDGE